MSQLDFSSLVACVSPVDGPAEEALGLGHNTDRRVDTNQTSSLKTSTRSSQSREATPSVVDVDNKLLLQLSQKPLNLNQGFVFGSDAQRSDKLLGIGPQDGMGISRVHFRLHHHLESMALLMTVSSRHGLRYRESIATTNELWLRQGESRMLKPGTLAIVRAGIMTLAIEMPRDRRPED